MKNQDVNMLYDVLTKLELVEMVLKEEKMDLKDLENLKKSIQNKIKTLL